MSDSEIKDIDPSLLDIIVCPVSHGRLQYDQDNHELICSKSNLAYPVRNGIPVLLKEEARDIES